MGALGERLIRGAPAGIDTKDQYFRALIADADAQPELVISESSDFNDGALANELEALRSYINYMTRANQVDELATTKLEAVAFAFFRLRRQFLENDLGLRVRMRSLSQRRFNQNWAGLEMIRDVLSYYIAFEVLWPIRMAVESNVILNGTFSELFQGWTRNTDGASIVGLDTINRFAGPASVELITDDVGSDAWIEQIVTVYPATYVLNFFISTPTPADEAISVVFQRQSDGLFWNGDAWQADPASISFRSAVRDWEVRSTYVVFDAADSVSIRFVTTKQLSYTTLVDFVEFGQAAGYPFSDIISITIGQALNFMPLAEGTEDPIAGKDYAEAGYLDHSFIGGSGGGIAAAFLEGIIDIVRPAGVRVRLRNISRDP